MDSAEGCLDGPCAPPLNVQSDVSLLAVDSISDLHNLTLDAESPHPTDASVTNHVTTAESITSPNTETVPSHPYRVCGLLCLNVVVVFFILLVLVNVCLLVYFLYLNGTRDKTLQSIADRLDAQTKVLRQIAGTRHIPGYNSSESGVITSSWLQLANSPPDHAPK